MKILIWGATTSKQVELGETNPEKELENESRIGKPFSVKPKFDLGKRE